MDRPDLSLSQKKGKGKNRDNITGSNRWGGTSKLAPLFNKTNQESLACTAMGKWLDDKHYYERIFCRTI